MDVKSIPVRDLRNEYGRILKEVEDGETFTVTNAGTPVATISPYVDPHVPGPRQGVPLADLLSVPPLLAIEEAETLKANLAEADWEPEDPWERHARLQAEQGRAEEDPRQDGKAVDRRAVRDWAGSQGISITDRGGHVSQQLEEHLAQNSDKSESR